MSIRTPIYNFIPFYQGDTWSATLTVKDSNDVAKDLTGYTAKMEIRLGPGTPILATLATTPGTGIVITAATGVITLSMTATVSAALTFKKAKYSLKLTSSGGAVTTILQGDFEIYPRITQ